MFALSRQSILATTLMVVTLLAVLASLPGSAGAAPLFSPTSVWNRPLTAAATLDPSSGARMATFKRELDKEIKGGYGPYINTTKFSTPFYVVPRSQPLVPVKLDVPAKPLVNVFAAGVPLPTDALPAAGTDGHLTVYQPSTDKLWEFWRTAKKSDGWHARWGGAMQNVSTNPGYFSSAAWPDLNPQQGWDWGSTATSLPAIAGTIRIDELRAGRIDHALAFAMPDACAGMFTWPAQRTDGRDTSKTCLPEGAHLRLSPSVDIASLNLPPIARMLAEAAQRYGIIVRDRTAYSATLYAEDPTPTGSNPYPALFGGLPIWKFMPKFPWGDLQLLKMTPCSKGPCVRPEAASAKKPARRR